MLKDELAGLGLRINFFGLTHWTSGGLGTVRRNLFLHQCTCRIHFSVFSQPHGVALDSGRLLLLRFPRGARRLLRRSVHLLVRGAHPLPVVRRLRRIHEVQRACRGFPSLPFQTAENSK